MPSMPQPRRQSLILCHQTSHLPCHGTSCAKKTSPFKRHWHKQQNKHPAPTQKMDQDRDLPADKVGHLALTRTNLQQDASGPLAEPTARNNAKGPPRQDHKAKTQATPGSSRAPTFYSLTHTEGELPLPTTRGFPQPTRTPTRSLSFSFSQNPKAFEDE